MHTAIVGIGNLLMRDDGVGVQVVRHLMELGLPPNVHVVDAGTSPDAAFALLSADRLIIVDAARLGGTPGTVYRLSSDEAAAHPVRSCHEIGLIETLRKTMPPSACPEILILAVEPGRIEWGLGLTAEVEAAVPRLIGIVEQELEGA